MVLWCFGALILRVSVRVLLLSARCLSTGLRFKGFGFGASALGFEEWIKAIKGVRRLRAVSFTGSFGTTVLILILTGRILWE